MDIKISIIPILGVVLCQTMASAQDDIPLLRPEERQAVDSQTAEFNQSLMPALTNAAKSTTRIWAGSRRLAYGTVVGDGHQVLTKWSEIARASDNLRIETSGGEVRAAKVSGVYEDEDLALLAIGGAALTPVQWSKESPVLGAFLAAPQPNGRPAAFGVVSVLERNLRDTDQAYLGIGCDLGFSGPGVKIKEVTAQSAAAAAGLQAGNIILKVGERPVSGLMELKHALVGVNPGSTVALLVQTDSATKKLSVVLGNRPQLPNFPDQRLRQMERMGGPISRVRASFTHAIQSDMRPQPDQIGGPVVDLKGQVVGITVARADRTRSFIMPAAAVQKLLQQKPGDPALAKTHQPDDAPSMSVRRRAAQGRQPAGDPELMRRHMTEMQRLMEHMREEMDRLDP
jgi:serine protease Do